MVSSAASRPAPIVVDDSVTVARRAARRSGWTPTSDPRAREWPGCDGDDTAGGVRRLGRRAARRLARRAAPPLRRFARSGSSHRASGARQAPACSSATRSQRSPLDLGPEPARIRAGHAGELRAGRRHRRTGRCDPRRRRVRPRRFDSARTSTSSGDSTRRAGRAGTSRPSRPTIRRGRRGGRGYDSGSTTDRRRRRFRSVTPVAWRRCG